MVWIISQGSVAICHGRDRARLRGIFWYIFCTFVVIMLAVATWQYRAIRHTQNRVDENSFGAIIGGDEAQEKRETANPAPIKHKQIASYSSFGQLLDEAKAGSVVAQRKVAELYGACMPYSLNPDGWLAGMDAMAAANPAIQAPMQGVKMRMSARCDQIDRGEPIPLDGVKGWQKLAADNGDVAARVRARISSIELLSSTEVAPIIDDVVASGDPDAMLELSQLLSRPVEGELPDRYFRLAGGETYAGAWAIAACRRGADCAAGSLLMDSLCINTGKCSYQTYGDYISSEVVPSGQRAEFNRSVEAILGLVTQARNAPYSTARQ
jgi:hypothetical protein